MPKKRVTTADIQKQADENRAYQKEYAKKALARDTASRKKTGKGTLAEGSRSRVEGISYGLSRPKSSEQKGISTGNEGEGTYIGAFGELVQGARRLARVPGEMKKNLDEIRRKSKGN